MFDWYLSLAGQLKMQSVLDCSPTVVTVQYMCNQKFRIHTNLIAHHIRRMIQKVDNSCS